MLFTPKWSKIKDLKEIEKEKSKNSKDTTFANTQLLDKNKPISKMNQVLNANKDFSNASSEAGSEADLEARLKADFDFNNNDKANLVSGILVTEANKSRTNKNKECKSNKFDAVKQANISNKIFKYIHITQCQRFYFLA